MALGLGEIQARLSLVTRDWTTAVQRAQQDLRALSQAAQAASAPFGAMGQSVAAITGEMQKRLELVNAQAQVFGRSFNAASESAAVLRQGIVQLLQAGVSPASAQIQSMAAQLRQLEAQGQATAAATDRMQSALSGMLSTLRAMGWIGVISFTIKQTAGSLIELGQAAFAAESGALVFSRMMDRTGQSLEQARRDLRALSDELRVPIPILQQQAAELLRAGYAWDQIRDIYRGAAASALLVGKSTQQGVETVTNALVTGLSVYLNQIGIVQNLNTAYQQYAHELGKTVDALSEADRAQAATRMIMRATAQEVQDMPVLMRGYAGSVSDLAMAWYEFRRDLGEKLIPTLTEAARALKDLLPTVRTMLQLLNDFKGAVVGGAIAAGLLKLASAMGAVDLAAKALGVTLSASGPVGLAIAALGVGIGLLIDRLSDAKKQADELKASMERLGPSIKIGPGGAIQVQGITAEQWQAQSEAIRKRMGITGTTGGLPEDVQDKINQLKADMETRLKQASEIAKALGNMAQLPQEQIKIYTDTIEQMIKAGAPASHAEVQAVVTRLKQVSESVRKQQVAEDIQDILMQAAADRGARLADAMLTAGRLELDAVKAAAEEKQAIDSETRGVLADSAVSISLQIADAMRAAGKAELDAFATAAQEQDRIGQEVGQILTDSAVARALQIADAIRSAGKAELDVLAAAAQEADRIAQETASILVDSKIATALQVAEGLRVGQLAELDAMTRAGQEADQIAQETASILADSKVAMALQLADAMKAAQVAELDAMTRAGQEADRIAQETADILAQGAVDRALRLADALRAAQVIELDAIAQESRKRAEAWAGLRERATGFVMEAVPIAHQMVQGATAMAPAGPWGMLAGALLPLVTNSQMFAGLMEQINRILQPLVNVLGMLLGALAPLVQAIGQVFQTLAGVAQPVIQAIANALGALMVALAPVIQILGVVLAPVFQVVGAIIQALVIPALQVLFPVLKTFGLIVGAVGLALGTLWNGLLSVIQSVFRALADISIFGWHPLGFLNDWANSLERVKVDTDAIAQALVTLAGLTWEQAQAAAQQIAASMALTDVTKQATEALINVPQALNLDLLRWRAAVVAALPSAQTGGVASAQNGVFVAKEPGSLHEKYVGPDRVVRGGDGVSVGSPVTIHVHVAIERAYGSSLEEELYPVLKRSLRRAAREAGLATTGTVFGQGV